MAYTITYYNEALQVEIMTLPDTLQARYFELTARMIEDGANLGDPHTKAFGDGVFELRLKGAEGSPACFIARLWVNRSSCCTAL